MRVLVIGGTGNVGSQVTQGLLQAGVVVRVLTRSADKLGSLPAGGKARSATSPRRLPCLPPCRAWTPPSW